VRYYVDAGAGGLAAGVHSTQFEIHDPKVGLLEPVLRLASDTAQAWGRRRGRELFRVAGVIGPTDQAVREAGLARELGYHACLLGLGALRDEGTDTLLAHCRAVAEVMPLVGFYLQPAAGGRVLPYAFWRAFADIENVVAVKIAPFNRYQTLDVVRAVCEAGRARDIALYTGNDDHIVLDLLAPHRVRTSGGEVEARMVGGLLGHWAFWTRRAVEQLDRIREVCDAGGPVPRELLTLAVQVTDVNAAAFDAANGYRGVLPGVHEFLRRQGLLAGTWCLDPSLDLSPGQARAIDRVCRQYPELNDDAFVAAHLDEWLAG